MMGSPYLEHSSCDVLFTVVTSDTKLRMIVRFTVWNTIPREEQQATQTLLHRGLQVSWDITQLKFVRASQHFVGCLCTPNLPHNCIY